MACFCLPFGQKPTSIGFTPPPGPVTADIALPLEARVLDEKGAPITTAAVSYLVEPAGVALVTASGDLRCTSTGDATVTLSSGELKQSFVVACRVVASIDGAPPTRVVIGKPGVFTPSAKDQKGNLLKDVPVTLTSSDEKVLAIVDGQLIGKAVGRATLQLRAGDLSVDAPIAVAEQMITESLSLKDGDGLNWALPEGTYEVEVGVTAMDNSDSGVTLSWVGASCPPQPEAQKHVVSCTVLTAASLQVLNPTKLGLGPMATGYATVYRVPATP